MSDGVVRLATSSFMAIPVRISPREILHALNCSALRGPYLIKYPAASTLSWAVNFTDPKVFDTGRNKFGVVNVSKSCENESSWDFSMVNLYLRRGHIYLKK